MRITDKTSFDIANESYKKYDIGDEITVSGIHIDLFKHKQNTQFNYLHFLYCLFGYTAIA
ncbi:hypothetical protein [Staphylococcus epidermidis]|uniref:hypothetical protein n=1 Tax=Staphylococcus epidermidis TaxID=1282 RepID=UPI003871BA20